MRAASALLATLTLVACAPAGEAQPERKTLPGPPVALETPPQEPEMSCDAAKAQFAVGQAYGEALAERARAAAGATLVRALRPGQMVTTEFRGDRLNLEVDAGGKVIAARCG